MFVNKKLKPFNTVETKLHFDNFDQLNDFVKQHNINDRQEFYFVIGTSEILWECVFESHYEG